MMKFNAKITIRRPWKSTNKVVVQLYRTTLPLLLNDARIAHILLAHWGRIHPQVAFKKFMPVCGLKNFLERFQV